MKPSGKWMPKTVARLPPSPKRVEANRIPSHIPSLSEDEPRVSTPISFDAHPCLSTAHPHQNQFELTARPHYSFDDIGTDPFLSKRMVRFDNPVRSANSAGSKFPIVLAEPSRRMRQAWYAGAHCSKQMPMICVRHSRKYSESNNPARTMVNHL